MNYDEAMSYIKNTAKFGSNLGLTRTERILQLLGDPHKRLKCIHIAGTNGKGSTTAMLTNILIEAGFKTGMYTSPYLQVFEERIQINNNNISKYDLSVVVTAVSEAVKKVVEEGYDHPTEFEIITCAMFLYFYNENVDYAVIEVGLGGRLDSTNVITPILSIITSISYDHMNILGNTLSQIAFEKAGIIKPEVPVIVYPQNEESLQVIEKVCIHRKSKLIKVPGDCVRFIDTCNNRQKIELKTNKDKYEIQLNLLGKHQLLNCAVVFYAVEELNNQGISISKKHITEGLYSVSWPGRMEVMQSAPKVLIDGAHNIDGIGKLSESLDTYFEYKNMYLILGILADKQVEEMVDTIAPKASKVFAVTPHSDRAEIAEQLAEVVSSKGIPCEPVEDYEKAYKKAISLCGRDDLLLICGSLYMIGDMRTLITQLRSNCDS
jgi:dihydrofolate synthase / folylpolyglutamate synthase